MVKVLCIISVVFVAACSADNKKQVCSAVYDEAALRDFVFATAGTDSDQSLRVLDSVLAKAAEDSAVFSRTVAFLEKPFGDPNSAFRNEDLYGTILQARMRSEWIDSAAKSKIRKDLYLLMQNRPGSAANDFTYRTASGFEKKMYDIKAEYTILYFYNPECPACKVMKTALISSPVISEKLIEGELKILAIYTDRDEKVWLDHLAEMPQHWMHGRDDGEFLYKNSIYNLKAIPTLYLLDRNKKVLLKDCVNVEAVEKVINGLDQ